MKESTRKLIMWAGIGIAIICAILSIIFAMNNGDVKDLAGVQKGGLFDVVYWILIAFIAISIVAMLIFLVIKLAHNFKEQPGYWKRFLLLVAAVIVVLLASFLLAKGNDVTPALLEKNNISEGTSKLIGAACILVYILVIAAAASIVFTECAKAFKKK